MTTYPRLPAGAGGAKALMTAMPTAQGLITITSVPTISTAGGTMAIAGTISPQGASVQVGLSTSATTPPSSTVGAVVNGGTWTASLVPASSGTYYVWALSGGLGGFLFLVVSAAITIQSGMTWTQVGSSPSGGVTAVASNAAAAVNQGTPIVHASAITYGVILTVGNGSTCTVGQFWFDTSATNTSNSAGSVAAGTLTGEFSVSGGTALSGTSQAPATAGTYYAKVQIVVTGTNAGTYTFTSQAITVT